MKFIQVLENNKRNGFFKNNAENETSYTPVFVFLKKLYEVKASGIRYNQTV